MAAGEARAVLRYVRIAPRKARSIVDLIRGQRVETALSTLKLLKRGGARTVEKVLRSAVANAQQKEIGDVDELLVVRAFVDGGPSLKRVFPRAMGRVNIIRRRTSHITLVLAPGTATKGNE